jgi:hypothetical protein
MEKALQRGELPVLRTEVESSPSKKEDKSIITERFELPECVVELKKRPLTSEEKSLRLIKSWGGR